MDTERRYPRTLEQAFGPYTSRSLHVEMPRNSRAVKTLYAVLLILAIGGCVLV